jgi:hypothetical protein
MVVHGPPPQHHGMLRSSLRSSSCCSSWRSATSGAEARSNGPREPTASSRSPSPSPRGRRDGRALASRMGGSGPSAAVNTAWVTDAVLLAGWSRCRNGAETSGFFMHAGHASDQRRCAHCRGRAHSAPEWGARVAASSVPVRVSRTRAGMHRRVAPHRKTLLSRTVPSARTSPQSRAEPGADAASIEGGQSISGNGGRSSSHDRRREAPRLIAVVAFVLAGVLVHADTVLEWALVGVLVAAPAGWLARRLETKLRARGPLRP